MATGSVMSRPAHPEGWPFDGDIDQELRESAMWREIEGLLSALEESHQGCDGIVLNDLDDGEISCYICEIINEGIAGIERAVERRTGESLE